VCAAGGSTKYLFERGMMDEKTGDYPKKKENGILIILMFRQMTTAPVIILIVQKCQFHRKLLP